MNSNRMTVVIICYLVGGLEHFRFSHILGIIIPTDFHMFQKGSNHQPVIIGIGLKMVLTGLD